MSKRILAAYAVCVGCTVASAILVFAVLFTAGDSLGWIQILMGIIISSIVASALLLIYVHLAIVKPANALAKGMKRVTSGNFDAQLDESEAGMLRPAFSDFNEMSASLLKVEALRESFVSNVAHEFKTPLSYVQGYSTLLQDDNLSADERREYIQHVNNATRRLSNMIGNLLEISSLTRPDSAIEMKQFSLDEQLRHILAVLMPQITRKDLNYEVDLEPIDIVGNESLLEDVWMNLVSNAVKFTPTGGTVTVSLEQQRDTVTVTVADTGCGMSKEQQEHAFDRFYQGDEAHSAEGNGLGLAIVRAVVKKHNGLVAVTSELGKGTTFTVTLPVDPTSR